MRSLLTSALAAAAVVASLASTPPAEAGPPRPHARHLDYLVIGDSIAQGYGTSDWVHHEDGSWERVDRGHSFPELARVPAVTKGGSCVTDPCGTGGVRTWATAVLDARAHRPTTLVVELGANDLVLGVSAEHLESDALAFKREMRRQGYRVVLTTVVPPPQSSAQWSVMQPQRLIYNDWVRTQRRFVDFARELECGGWLCARYTSDLQDVHVGNLGAKAMAGALQRWLAEDLARRTT